jgi:hypothetical protein
MKKTCVGDEAVVETKCALVGECGNLDGCVLERLEASSNEAVVREAKRVGVPTAVTWIVV